MTLEEIRKHVTIDHVGKKDFEVKFSSSFIQSCIERHQHAIRRVLSQQEALKLFENTFTIDVIRSLFELVHDYELEYYVSSSGYLYEAKYLIVLKRI